MAGKHAKGVSDRSGFIYPLHKMKKEWNGLLVGPDEFETKHPQLTIRRIPADPKPLRNPRPDKTDNLFLTIGERIIDPIPLLFTDAYLANPGSYDLDNDTLKLSLYSVPLSASIAAYTTTDEIVGGGYVAGGQEAQGNQVVWTSGGFEFVAGLLYDATNANASIAVYPFGLRKVVRQGLTVRNLLP
jgi:hypothetical protein